MPLRPALFLFGVKRLRKLIHIELFISMWYNFYIAMINVLFDFRGKRYDRNRKYIRESKSITRKV